jgi:hypothetical protein
LTSFKLRRNPKECSTKRHEERAINWSETDEKDCEASCSSEVQEDETCECVDGNSCPHISDSSNWEIDPRVGSRGQME